MSQDIFAAFVSDDTHAGPRQKEKPDGELSGSDGAQLTAAVTSPTPILATFDEDEDDFGDFEDASNTGTAKAPTAEAITETDTLVRSRVHNVPPSRLKYSPPAQSVKVTSSPPRTMPTAKPTYPPPRKITAPASNGMAQKAAARPSKPAPEIGAHPFAGRMDFLFEADDDEYNAGTDEIADIASNPEAAMAYSKRIILEQQAREEATKQAERLPRQGVPKQRELMTTSKEVAKQTRSSPPAKQTKAEVLFDAEDDSGWDEAREGTAEVTTNQHSVKPTVLTPAVDLLALDDGPPGSILANERTNTPIRPITEMARTLHHQNMVARKPSSSLPQGTNADDDEWDDFEDAPVRQPAARSLGHAIEQSSTRDQVPTAPQSSIPASRDQQPLPTNVPPPSVLLSIFPSLLEFGNEALFNTLSKLDATQRATLLSHPATHQFLRGYLALVMSLAHIIAGRKLRWKRDSHLAQSMRIGPSVTGGGKGGMKLTGVDRGELAKEDREVLDCIRLWKMQVGKVRSAVAGAVSGRPAGEAKMPQVPEVAEQMIIKTLKVDEGGFTAPAACALCGLKREERVLKVDVEVEDSFGEWWVDGANCHAVCLNFWGEHKEKLRSR